MKNFNKVFMTSLIFGSLMLLATTSTMISNSKPLEVYAVDNCDATSTCTNTQTGTGNSQTNNCINSSDCSNEANGNNNIQTNRCDSVPGPEGCDSTAIGDRNTQNMDCREISGLGCGNFAEGNDNSQNLQCTESDFVCLTVATGDRNTQNIDCTNVSSGCDNEVGGPQDGNDNTQTIDCTNIAFRCSNIVLFGDRNIQDVDCTNVDSCDSFAGGDDNVQTLDCNNVVGEFSGCSNTAFRNSIQDLDCSNVGSNCGNFALGEDSNQNLDCTNIGVSCGNVAFDSSSVQNVNCSSVEGSCFNTASGGSDPNQNINCRAVGIGGCSNFVQPDASATSGQSVQNVNCIDVASGCVNWAFDGDEIDQNLVCARSTQCTNNSTALPVSFNKQSTTCANADCSNVGVNTNVVANSANCESHGPDTTTICQPGRTIIRPNS